MDISRTEPPVYWVKCHSCLTLLKTASATLWTELVRGEEKNTLRLKWMCGECSDEIRLLPSL